MDILIEFPNLRNKIILADEQERNNLLIVHSNVIKNRQLNEIIDMFNVIIDNLLVKSTSDFLHSSLSQLNDTSIDNKLNNSTNFYFNYLINLLEITDCKSLIRAYDLFKNNIKIDFLKYIINNTEVIFSLKILYNIIEPYDNQELKLYIIDLLSPKIKPYKNILHMTIILNMFSDQYKLQVSEKLLVKYKGKIDINIIEYVLSRFNNDQNKLEIICYMFNTSLNINVDKESIRKLFIKQIDNKIILNNIFKLLGISTNIFIRFEKFTYYLKNLKLKDCISFYDKNKIIKIIKKSNKRMRIKFLSLNNKKLSKSINYSENIIILNDQIMTEKMYITLNKL